jgi:hypothetical protein
MNQSLETVVAHVVETLPDDLHKRRKLLNAVLECVPASQVPDELREMLSLLDRHILAHRQLALDFGGCRGTGRLGDLPLQRGAGRLGDQPLLKGGRK